MSKAEQVRSGSVAHRCERPRFEESENEVSATIICSMYDEEVSAESEDVASAAKNIIDVMNSCEQRVACVQHQQNVGCCHSCEGVVHHEHAGGQRQHALDVVAQHVVDQRETTCFRSKPLILINRFFTKMCRNVAHAAHCAHAAKSRNMLILNKIGKKMEHFINRFLQKCACVQSQVAVGHQHARDVLRTHRAYTLDGLTEVLR